MTAMCALFLQAKMGGGGKFLGSHYFDGRGYVHTAKFYNRAYKHIYNIPVKQTKTPIMDAFSLFINWSCYLSHVFKGLDIISNGL
ncbi:hypothetical protein [Oenococcus oeni]|uniref:hypothetical protein n=3 Tax=Oenococcus oeni TaxID=1247 RepID=UPI0008F92A3B|nr:hypothetical protein [Oenococcus oeni]OIK95257.1 hypothetical protein ATW84_09940 [Oenococcus oeni]UCU86710.1 hypothetical protein J3U91_00855 [Oenococcus oeni]